MELSEAIEILEYEAFYEYCDGKREAIYTVLEVVKNLHTEENHGQH